MSTEIVRYPLDMSGENPDNRITGEEHELEDLAIRVLAPKYGPFFTHNLVVVDTTTGLPLRRGRTQDGGQFRIAEIMAEATKDVGREVAELIVIEDPTVSKKVLVDYNCIGENYHNNSAGLIKMYEAIMNDSRPVDWVNIINKWSTYPPTLHKHLLRDIIGFEPMVVAMERIRSAIILGNTPAFGYLTDWMTRRTKELEDRLDSFTGSVNELLTEHIGNKDNPHETTADQVDSYTKEQLDILLSNLRTDLGGQLLQLQNDFAAHVAARNPHGTTPADIGAPSISQMNAALATLENNINQRLDDHIAERNPHGTQASDVGAPSVIQMNNALAALQATMNNALAAHVAQRNPHGTQAPDVGAPTIAQMNSAVSGAIAAAASALSEHAANPNAHGTTPGDIGAPTVAEMTNAIGVVQDDLTAHKNQRNPHGTQAADTGAPTIVQMNTAISDMQSSLRAELEEHENERNPHGTQAADVGAPTITQMNTAVANARSDMMAALATHTAERNPHGTQAADVGAPTVASMNAAITTSANTRLPLAGGNMTGAITGSPNARLAMVPWNNTANGNLTIRCNTGTGDQHVAGMTFHHQQYAIKFGVRHDGVIGWGGWSTSAWRFYQDHGGNVYSAGDITAYSDERLKKGFKKLSSVRSKLFGITGWSFTWRQHEVNGAKSGKYDIGFAAGEVERHFPEAVHEGMEHKGTAYKAVAYQKFAPYHHEAIKEHYLEIDSLKAQNAELQQQLKAVLNQVDKMQKRLDAVSSK